MESLVLSKVLVSQVHPPLDRKYHHDPRLSLSLIATRHCQILNIHLQLGFFFEVMTLFGTRSDAYVCWTEHAFWWLLKHLCSFEGTHWKIINRLVEIKGYIMN